MAFNPPETRDEIRDTLYFLGIPYSYEKIKSPKGHVFTFDLGKHFISIYGPGFLKMGKTRFTSAYDLKCAILQEYRHLI